MNLGRLDKFYKTRPGHLVFGLVELLMAYGFASWAIDTGNLLWWLATIFLLAESIHNFVRAIRGRKK